MKTAHAWLLLVGSAHLGFKSKSNSCSMIFPQSTSEIIAMPPFHHPITSITNLDGPGRGFAEVGDLRNVRGVACGDFLCDVGPLGPHDVAGRLDVVKSR